MFPGLGEADFLERLRLDFSSREELAWFMDRLTIGETYFFRHPEVFEALRTSVFPAWLQEGRSIFAWSAACSNGAEAYSLSVCWKEFLRGSGRTGPPLSILGTDINRECIKQARAAAYSKWSLRNLPSETTANLFQQNAGQYQLRADFLHDVRFEHFNLLENPEELGLSPGSVDLIFCRNVLIYFSAEIISRLLEQFYALLRPGGWLVPGASECAAEYFQSYEVVNFPGAILYRKPDSSPAASGFPLAREGSAFTPDFASSPISRAASSESARVQSFTDWQPPVLPPWERPKTSSAPAIEPRVQTLEKICPAFPPTEPASLRRMVSNLLLLDELNPDWHYLDALLFVTAKDDGEAEARLRRTLFLDRSHPGALVELSLLLARQARVQAARKSAVLARHALENMNGSHLLLCHAGWRAVGEILELLQREFFA